MNMNMNMNMKTLLLCSILIVSVGCRTQTVLVETEQGIHRQECTQIMPFPLAPSIVQSDPWYTVSCEKPVMMSSPVGIRERGVQP